MAYISQEEKKRIVAEVKKVLPKGWKATFSVRDKSTLVCTIKEMPKADLLALAYCAEDKDLIRKHVEIQRERLNCSFADYYFSRYIFDDFSNDEFFRSFRISTRAKGVEYKPYEFEQVFASGTGVIYPFNIQTETQKKAFEKLMNVINALACENYNESDYYSDYINVGYYMNLDFGTDEKPCKLI